MNKSEVKDYSGFAVENLSPGDVIIHEEEIITRIRELAREIAQDCRGQNLLIIGLLNGAVPTTVELGKALHMEGLDDVEVDFLQVGSYGNESLESGQVKVNDTMMKTDVGGRNILVVDDIGDTLHTFAAVASHFAARNPLSMRTLVLLDKPSRHEVELPIDYIGFQIPDVWVEGFGMDSYGLGRFNPNIVKGPTHDRPSIR